MRLWGLLLFWLVVATTQTHAAIQTLALTGAPVPSIPGETFDLGDNVFGLARLSNNGMVAYSATLGTTALSVHSGNNDVIFRYDDGNSTVAVREGSGGVPNLLAASFDIFNNFVIDNDGSMLMRGQLEIAGDINSSNSNGLWKFDEEAAIEVSRTGSMHAPGVSGVRYESLGVLLKHSSNGNLVYEARLKIEGGTTSANDNGIWVNIGGTGSLVTREGQTAPGVAATFDVFGSPSVSNDGSVAFRSQLKSSVTINITNRIGIWKYSSGVGSLRYCPKIVLLGEIIPGVAKVYLHDCGIFQ